MDERYERAFVAMVVEVLQSSPCSTYSGEKPPTVGVCLKKRTTNGSS